MIFKSYLVETNLGTLKENIVLFYGENTGLKIDLRSIIKNLNKEALIINLDQDHTFTFYKIMCSVGEHAT